jgi:hypothetical protein
MLALAVIVFAVLVAGALFLFFWSVVLTRASKHKRVETVKSKRDESDRLILADDGELIDFDRIAAHGSAPNRARSRKHD